MEGCRGKTKFFPFVRDRAKVVKHRPLLGNQCEILPGRGDGPAYPPLSPQSGRIFPRKKKCRRTGTSRSSYQSCFRYLQPVISPLVIMRPFTGCGRHSHLRQPCLCWAWALGCMACVCWLLVAGCWVLVLVWMWLRSRVVYGLCVVVHVGEAEMDTRRQGCLMRRSFLPRDPHGRI